MAGRAQTEETIDDSGWDEDVTLALPVGSNVWYCLRPDGEWVRAKVIDRIEKDTKLDPPLESNQLHLKVKLNRQKNHAASNAGYRLNVPQGTIPGSWAAEKPEGADEAYEQNQERQRLLVLARQEAMRQQ